MNTSALALHLCDRIARTRACGFHAAAQGMTDSAFWLLANNGSVAQSRPVFENPRTLREFPAREAALFVDGIAKRE